MKNIRNLLLIMACFSLIFITSCEKETKTTAPQSEELQCDANCGNDAILKFAEREIVFYDVPYTIEFVIDLDDDADLVISARDCCIPDDIVEIYVDGCLIAIVDAVDEGGASGSHLGEVHTVALLAGTHTVTYINTVSAIGGSGWIVSEIAMEFSGNYCFPCDDDCDGVLNEEDNCVDTFNPGQENCDGDEFGDVCDVDDDNDGVLDEVDVYICSDMTPTIIIDMCDTYVENQVFPDGLIMMDLILECAANAMNHGEFVSCVSHLTNDWKSNGWISGREKGKITDCAANAMIP